MTDPPLASPAAGLHTMYLHVVSVFPEGIFTDRIRGEVDHFGFILLGGILPERYGRAADDRQRMFNSLRISPGRLLHQNSQKHVSLI